MNDRDALDLIAKQLDGREWDGGSIEAVAVLVAATGRTIRPPMDEAEEAEAYRAEMQAAYDDANPTPFDVMEVER